MEADWEIEIGKDAPVIDACWPGFVELRVEPERVRELHEVHRFPALANALLQLNARGSPTWTAKCDVWTVNGFDRFELDAPEHEAQYALACYIDLLPVTQWALLEQAIAVCTNLCAHLRSVATPGCRADLVIRSAIARDDYEFGITAYLTACGSTEAGAAAQLVAALAAFADAVSSAWFPAPERSKLQ
jgi:hypothetical protein